MVDTGRERGEIYFTDALCKLSNVLACLSTGASLSVRIESGVRKKDSCTSDGCERTKTCVVRDTAEGKLDNRKAFEPTR